MNIEELRRLAEQAIAGPTPYWAIKVKSQTILSLLDELNSEQMERSDAERQLSATRDERDAAEVRADRWHQALLVAEQRSADASERVAALEEGLRYMKAQIEEEIAGASDGSFFDSGALAAYNWVLSLFPVLQASVQDTSEGSGK